MAKLGSGKRHRGVGAHRIARHRSAVAGQAGWQIDRDHLGVRETSIDLPDEFGGRPARRSRQPRPQERIDHQRRAPHGRRNNEAKLAAHRLEHAQVRGRVAGQIFGTPRQNHIQRTRTEARKQLTGNHQPISAVIPFPAKHHYAVVLQRSVPLNEKLHHPEAGVLHQNQAGNPAFDGAPVHLAHLRRSQHLHARTSASICSRRRKLRGSPITTK